MRGRLVPAVLIASVLASLDLFVVNLAFSAIAAHFPEASTQAMSWLLNGYAIAFGALLVPAGRLAGRFGSLRLFRVGLVAFGAGSVLAALAPGIGTLITARVVQGAGAALLVPTSLALLLSRYPASQHKRKVSIWAAAGSVAAAAGPVLGGVLADLDWRWIFLMNVPLAIGALLLTRSQAPDPQTTERMPDLLGVGLLATGMAALVTALSYVTDWGLASPRLWALVAASLAATAWFIHRSLTQAAPAMNLRLFREPTFSTAAVGMIGFYTGFAIMLLGGSLFLTLARSWNPATAGLAFSAGPAAAVISALVAGRTSLAPQWLAALGGGFFVVAGTLWYALLHDPEYFTFALFAGLVLTGIGAGIAQLGFLSGGVSRLPGHHYATATGALNTARQVGTSIGVALLIALTGAGTTAADYRTAWIVMVCAGLLATASAAAIRRGPPSPDGP